MTPLAVAIDKLLHCPEDDMIVYEELPACTSSVWLNCHKWQMPLTIRLAWGPHHTGSIHRRSCQPGNFVELRNLMDHATRLIQYANILNSPTRTTSLVLSYIAGLQSIALLPFWLGASVEHFGLSEQE